MGTVVMHLVCDTCGRVVLEKPGSQNLDEEKFPISKDEAEKIDKEHRGHQCHIEAVEKEQ